MSLCIPPSVVKPSAMPSWGARVDRRDQPQWWTPPLGLLDEEGAHEQAAVMVDENERLSCFDASVSIEHIHGMCSIETLATLSSFSSFLWFKFWGLNWWAYIIRFCILCRSFVFWVISESTIFVLANARNNRFTVAALLYCTSVRQKILVYFQNTHSGEQILLPVFEIHLPVFRYTSRYIGYTVTDTVTDIAMQRSMCHTHYIRYCNHCVITLN